MNQGGIEDRDDTVLRSNGADIYADIRVNMASQGNTSES